MTHLIKYDAEGVMGPLATLIEHYDTATEDEKVQLALVFRVNAHKLKCKVANIPEPLQFSPLRPLLENEPFKTFAKADTDIEVCNEVKNKLLPKMTYAYKFTINDEIATLVAKVLQSYIDSPMLLKMCNNTESEETSDKRKEIGIMIYSFASKNLLIKKEFDTIIKNLKYTIAKTGVNNTSIWLSIDKLLTVSMATNILQVKIVNGPFTNYPLLDAKFEMYDNIKKNVTVEELNIINDIYNFVCKSNDNKNIWSFTSKYINLFTMSNRSPDILGLEVVTLLDTVFRDKFPILALTDKQIAKRRSVG